MLKNMKIAVKLAMGFSIAVIALIVIIILSISNMGSMNNEMKVVITDRFQKTVWINQVIEQLNISSMALRDGILENNPAEIEKYVEKIKNTGKVAKPIWDKMEKKLNTEKGKALFKNIMDKRKEYIPVRDTLIHFMKLNQDSIATRILFTEFNTIRLEYEGAMNELKELLVKLVDDAGENADETYSNSKTLMFIISGAVLLIIILIALLITNSITKPINQAVAAAGSIAKGDLNVNLETTNKDETGKLLNSMKIMAGSINNLVKETNELIDAANKGKLDFRGNADNFTGSWQEMVGGINKLVDSFVAPINLTAEYIDRISKGDIPQKITDTYYGDFNEIKNNINACIDVMNFLLAETNKQIDSVKNGKLDLRADSSKFTGEWATLINGVNNLVDNFVKPINVTAEYIDRISKGDIPPKITDEYKGDFNEIKNNLNQCIDAVNALVADAAMLSKAAAEGKLDTRADAVKHGGDFRAIIDGVNKTLDNVIGPLNVAAEYVDRISKGDIPPHITDVYNGDFNEIKNNLNQCIDSVNLLVKDAGMLSVAAVEGRLFARAAAEKHNGDFRKIIAGVNSTIDSLVGLLDNMPAPSMIINTDFEIQFMNKAGAGLNNTTGIELFKSKTKCYDHFKMGDCKTQNCACQKAITTKAEAVRETDAHPGNYNLDIQYTGIPIKDTQGNVVGAFEIVVDQTEIKKSLKEAEAAMSEANKAKIEVQAAMEKAKKVAVYQDAESVKMVKAVEELADGNFKAHIELTDPDDDTREAYETLMKILLGVRKFKDAVMALQEDAVTLADYAEQGQLDKRADTNRHNGEFRTVVHGMNNMLDKVLDPINEGSRVLEIMATGDLTSRMTGDYKGGHAKIKESINSVGDSLSSLISQVLEMTQNVSSIALQMSSTAETMAAGSQEQAAQADDVSSAVEEMSRTITENAMAAHKTVEEAEKNKNIAREGGTVVEQTVQKMKDIAGVVSQSASNMEKLGDSSTRIGEIISVIDDIADQTNLLALNAAIEAARAGEQGRGFAVVADEVRKLAERTTEATKQIADMIKGIQNETQNAVKVMNVGNQEVTNGIQLADQAGKSLKEIVDSSQDVQMMINQIAAASEEQSSTSEEIAKNVQSINQVTNESAKRIQDIAESSDNLARMIESLGDLLRQFKVSYSGSGEKPKVLGNGAGKKQSRQYLESNY